MNTGQTAVFVFAGLALLALVNGDSLDDSSSKSLFKLLQPSYSSLSANKRGSDLDDGYESEPDLNWGSAPISYNFGSFIRRPPSYRRNVMEDKRFGYVGSRGKRMGVDRLNAFSSLKDLLDLYDEKARALPFRSSYRTLTNDDPAVFNSKRQPHFGFHGVRG